MRLSQFVFDKSTLFSFPTQRAKRKRRCLTRELSLHYRCCHVCQISEIKNIHQSPEFNL